MQSRSALPKFSSFSFGGGGRGGGTFFRLLKRKISPGPSLCCRAFPPLLKIPSRVNWRDNHDDMERNKQLRRRHSIYLLVQLIKGLELLLRLRLNACNSSCQCALYSKRKKKTGPKNLTIRDSSFPGQFVSLKYHVGGYLVQTSTFGCRSLFSTNTLSTS